MLKLVLALLLLGALTAPAAAQDESVEEIVVTGSRMVDWDPDDIPHVAVVRQADNLVTSVRVECDTRDRTQRLNELRATLRNLVRAAAQDRAVDLGVGSDVVGSFDESQLDRIIVPDGQKPDVSYAALLVKTAVQPGDSFDQATARIREFVRRTEKVGRTEVLLSNDWDLTLVQPNRYRAQILKAVAEDARSAAASFGEGYGVRLEGLENRVAWYQHSPLELALFIPYTLEIAPK